MPTWSTMTDLSTDDLVTEADMDALRGNIEYLLDPNKQRILRDNGSDYTTTSTSFVDVDATNLAATITTNGGPVLVIVNSVVWNSGGYTDFDVTVDGARIGGSFAWGLLRTTNGGSFETFCIAALVPGLSAGSHTFKLQWKVTAGTGHLLAQAAKTPTQLSVIEL